MTKSNQSIAPDTFPGTSPQIDDTETQGTLATGPTGKVHRGAGPIPRSTRTPEQRESNRVFMAAAGRVKFGRHEATLHAIWIAFALFASLGPERICYAAVERKREDEDEDKPGIAERAKVSGRTVQPSHPRSHRTRPDLRREPSGRPHADRVESHPPRRTHRTRIDSVSRPGRDRDVRRDKRIVRTYRAAAPSRGQARVPVKRGLKVAAVRSQRQRALKGSPAPSPSPTHRRVPTARADRSRTSRHMREVAQT